MPVLAFNAFDGSGETNFHASTEHEPNMSQFDVSEIKACTFDTGGTVLDWYSGITAAISKSCVARGLSPSLDYGEGTKEYRRRALKQMINARNPDFNIDAVHRRVLDELAEDPVHGPMWASHLTAEDKDAIAKAWHGLDAWKDFAPGLARLRKKFTVVSFTILSTTLIIDTAKRNGIEWDAVVSCEMIGSYKLNSGLLFGAALWLSA